MGMRDVRPNSAVSSTSSSGAQLLFGLPSTRPPRPAAKVMIARTEEGFRLENAIAPHPPPDCPTTMAFPGVTIPSPSMKSINDCQSRSPKVRIVAVSNAGKEEAMMSALRHCGCLLDKLVGGAIVVRLTIHTPAAPSRKGDDRAYRRGVQAGECDSTPSGA